MAINTSQSGQNIKPSAAQRRVSAISPVSLKHGSPGQKTDRASPPPDRAVTGVTGAPASPGAPLHNTHAQSPTPLVHELLTTGGAGQLPELLTLSEVCAFLKVKPSYIYSLTSTDRIPFRKFGGTLRFVKAELLLWLDRGRRGPR
ncbi:MAG: helix-turn-helix domain-containing protein [Nitrospira sp.]|nr:helix-turn-helix domain-containing protein [Nitrospira sp.]